MSRPPATSCRKRSSGSPATDRWSLPSAWPPGSSRFAGTGPSTGSAKPTASSPWKRNRILCIRVKNATPASRLKGHTDLMALYFPLWLLDAIFRQFSGRYCEYLPENWRKMAPKSFVENAGRLNQCVQRLILVRTVWRFTDSSAAKGVVMPLEDARCNIPGSA